MIKNVKVDWVDGYANDPSFVVELDGPLPAYPSKDEPVWERFEDGFHVAYTGSVVRYFYTDGKPTQGFGGRPFVGTFQNGDSFSYRGAWSSRAGCINALEGISLRIVDVSIGHVATAVVSADLYNWWVRNPDCGFGLAWVTQPDSEMVLLPTRDGKLKNKPREDAAVFMISRD